MKKHLYRILIGIIMCLAAIYGIYQYFNTRLTKTLVDENGNQVQLGRSPEITDLLILLLLALLAVLGVILIVTNTYRFLRKKNATH